MVIGFFDVIFNSSSNEDSFSKVSSHYKVDRELLKYEKSIFVNSKTDSISEKKYASEVLSSMYENCV